jgi:thiamine-monophosphate kinase
MSNVDDAAENAAISRWAGRFRRASAQINKTHEADAEIYADPAFPDHYLAVTIDTVDEEIASGIYRDPFTMGWVSIMASLSDLAATGAVPLGLVISTTVEQSRPAGFIERIACGMEEAALACGTFILGGDTNSGSSPALTSCAVGLVPRGELMMRSGMAPGQTVFATGPLGSGNALGLARLAGVSEEQYPESGYRPFARLEHGILVRRHASWAMDTSDGLLATLDQLMRINGKGFVIEAPWKSMIGRRARDLCAATQTPEWMMLAGPHGEFELVFGVASERLESFHAGAQAAGFTPLMLGTVQENQSLTRAVPGAPRGEIDFLPLRNAIHACGAHPQDLLRQFEAFGKEAGLTRIIHKFCR